MRSLLESPAEDAKRSPSSRLPWLVAAMAIVATALSLFVGTRPLPVFPAFIPAVMTATTAAYVLTGLHLLRLYVLTGRRRLAVLGVTFVLTGLLVAAYLIVFPGVTPVSSQWLAAINVPSRLWMLWHLVFSLGIIASLLVNDAERLATPAIERTRSRHVVWSFVALPLVAVFGTYSLVLVDPYLPALMVGDNYTSAHTWLQFPLLAFGVAALAFTFRRARNGTVLDRWLIVCVLIAFCDVQMDLDAMQRYNFGWYLSRSLSLVSASILLFALLDDFARIYGNLALAHDALRRLAETDPMTKLASREHALDRATSLLALDAPFCLAILDLDHFKQVNDTYGHLVGDDVLRAVSSRLVRALKADDLVGRLGGEEFILIHPGLNLLQARAVAERVLEGVRASPIATRSASIQVTSSLGLAAALPGEPLDHLLSRADAALYEAKHAGRNRLALAQ